MTAVQLPNLAVTLHPPVKIDQAIGHTWFPVVHQFPSGELVARWSIMPDTHAFAYVAANSHSTDGGKTWSPPYSTGQWGNLCMPLPDGNLRMVPYYVYPDPPSQKREFVTDLYTLHPGGRYEVQPRAVRLTGLSRHFKIQSTGAAAFNFNGTCVERDGAWLYTMYGTWDDDPTNLANVILIASDDRGRTWRYVSTIASHEDIADRPDAPGSPLEGPDEASLCELASGELLCVYRVGSGLPKWPYHASRSADGGRTWSQPEILSPEMGSVEPSLKRLSNGVLALSGGRPGLHLWLSTDPDARQWEHIDIAAHHNAARPESDRITVGGKPAKIGEFQVDFQTTAYTELCEIAPGRLLMIYDRAALGWHPVPLDSEERNMIFVVEIEVGKS